MKIAVMQPYLFPYVGYFQLVNYVDTFVFYDDVSFIKGGWINRNNILLNKKTTLFTVPLKNASSNSLIKDTEVNKDLYRKWYKKFDKTVTQAYSKAPYFEEVKLVLDEVLSKEFNSICEYAICSVQQVAKYLEINTRFLKSSDSFSETKGLNRVERLLKICEQEKALEYVNPINGKDLYHLSDFQDRAIDLKFLKSMKTEYKQYSFPHTPSLSIIDVIMFNDKEIVKEELLKNFELV